MGKGDRTEEQQREQADGTKTREAEGGAKQPENAAGLGAAGASVVGRMAASRPGGSPFTVPAVLDTTKFSERAGAQRRRSTQSYIASSSTSR